MAKDIFYYYGIFSTIITCINITGNTLTVIAFINDKSLRVNPSNTLILALSVTDLLYGLTVFTFVSVPYVFALGYPYGEAGCMTLVTFSNLYVVGNLLLVAISIDRISLVGMNYSKYVKMQTPKRMKVFICICYSTGIAAALFELSLWKHAKNTIKSAASIDFDNYCISPSRYITWFGPLYSLGLFCVPAVVVGILSAVFFVLLHARIQNTRKIGNSVASGSVSQAMASRATQSSVTATVNASQAAEARSSDSRDDGSDTKNRYIKPAITLGALVASMLFCLFPYCIFLIVGVFCRACNKTDVRFILLLFVQMNPMLDPIFYAATQRNIRRFYKTKCSKLYKWVRP